jgi:hypothetical protein
MAVTVYQSTDAGAAALTLSGTAGDLVRLLDAVLINGYSGKAAAGWAIAYTAANKRSYRPASGNRYYLYVDDAAGVVTAAYALMRGYESMASAADAGTNPFPSVAQVTNGCQVTKSSAASAAVRPWIIIANATFFYLFIDTTETAFSSGSFYCSFFGDFVSYKSPSETYNTIICAQNGGCISPIGAVAANSALNAGYIARKYDGTSISGAAAISPISDLNGLLNAAANSGALISLVYPETISGKLYSTPVYVIEYIGASGAGVRGWLPGLWIPCHQNPLTHADTYSGAAGSANGKSFLVIKIISAVSATVGQLHMETSDTWTGVSFT